MVDTEMGVNFFRPSFASTQSEHHWTVQNSSIALWTCTKSQKYGQSHKNTGVLDGRFSHMPVFKRATWIQTQALFVLVQI